MIHKQFLKIFLTAHKLWRRKKLVIIVGFGYMCFLVDNNYPPVLIKARHGRLRLCWWLIELELRHLIEIENRERENYASMDSPAPNHHITIIHEYERVYNHWFFVSFFLKWSSRWKNKDDAEDEWALFGVGLSKQKDSLKQKLGWIIHRSGIEKINK